MKLSRRQFIATGGALAAATLAPRPLLAALETKPGTTSSVTTWADVRRLFNLEPGYLHFSSFYLASHPAPVRAAIDDYRRALDANPYLFVEHKMFQSETEQVQRKIREVIATYLGGRQEEIALTGSTTMGLALVYHGLPLAPGDDVLTTTHDHYSHHESIRLATERAHATMRRIPLFDRSEAASPSEIVARLRSAIRPATRVVGVTWVHSSSGVRLPIRAIADMLADVNRGRDAAHRVRLVVDGVHGLGAVDESVADLGCDYFCAGTHKWIFAPRGTGIVWARAENWAAMRPMIPDFSSLDSFENWMNDAPPPKPTTAAHMTPGGFTAYEHQWAMSAAFQLHARMGRARVAERIRQLNDQCKAGLAKMANVTLHTPRDPSLSAGLVAFEVAGKKPEDVVKRLLEKRIVASTSPYRITYARLSPSLVNSPEEVDTALREVRNIAGA
jgi:isopenicillin-N epimerase